MFTISRSTLTPATARATTAHGRTSGVLAAPVPEADSIGSGGVFVPRMPRAFSPTTSRLPRPVKRKKDFDCLKMEEEIRARIYAEIKDMSPAERIACFHIPHEQDVFRRRGRIGTNNATTAPAPRSASTNPQLAHAGLSHFSRLTASNNQTNTINNTLTKRYHS